MWVFVVPVYAWLMCDVMCVLLVVVLLWWYQFVHSCCVLLSVLVLLICVVPVCAQCALAALATQTVRTPLRMSVHVNACMSVRTPTCARMSAFGYSCARIGECDSLRMRAAVRVPEPRRTWQRGEQCERCCRGRVRGCGFGCC